MLTRKTIAANAERFKEQIRRYLDFCNGRALMLNNADWLLPSIISVFSGRSARNSRSTAC